MKHENVRYSGSGQGSLRSYMIGFVLSVILTVAAFFVVMNGSVSVKTTLICITVFAVIQILVHLVYFLHMNSSSEEVWNFVSLAFTLVIIAIIVGGSLWIMYNLNINMMPE